MMEQDETIGPVNLGNPNEFTILALAEKVKALTGSNSAIIYNPLPQDDPVQRKPDITLAQKYLKWKPRVEVDEGLRQTIDYFRRQANIDALIYVYPPVLPSPARLSLFDGLKAQSLSKGSSQAARGKG